MKLFGLFIIVAQILGAQQTTVNNVKPTSKQGDGNLFQLSKGSVTGGNFPVYDAKGNTIDSGKSQFSLNTSLTDLRAYGAVCDGTTNIQPAVTAALAAGKTNLFMPANCLWIPTNNRTPPNVVVICESNSTSMIKTANPPTDHWAQSQNSMFQNCAQQNAFVYSGPGIGTANFPHVGSQYFQMSIGDGEGVGGTWPNSFASVDIHPTLRMTPDINICGVTNHTGFFQIQTCTPHGYQNNHTVVVYGVNGTGGMSAVNRITTSGYPEGQLITVIDPTHFDLYQSTFAGSYGSGGKVYIASTDMPGFSIAQRSAGGAYYVGISSYGIGFDSWINGGETIGTAGAHPIGYKVTMQDAAGVATGFLMDDNSNSTGSVGFLLNRNGSTPGIVIAGSAQHGDDLAFSTGTKLDGHFISIFQGISTYADSVISMNMNTGYNGRFLDLTINNTTKFWVVGAGHMWAAGSITANGGTLNVLRCVTAGALPVGALTVTAGSCGTSSAIGFIGN